MTCTICVGIFQTSTRCVGIFLRSPRYVGIFSNKHQICRHFLQTSTGYPGIFSGKRQICRHFLEMAQIFSKKLARFLILARGHFILYNTHLRSLFGVFTKKVTKNRRRNGRRILDPNTNIKRISPFLWNLIPREVEGCTCENFCFFARKL